MLARERLKFNLFSLLYQLNAHYCAFSWYIKLNTLISKMHGMNNFKLQFNSEFNSVLWASASASASLRYFGYRIFCLQASVLLGCDDVSLDGCCPTFRDSTVVSFSRVEMSIFLYLKINHYIVSKRRAKITQCRIATSKKNADINRNAAKD